MKLELVVFHCFLEEDWMDMVLREILVIVYPIVIRHVCQTTDSKYSTSGSSTLGISIVNHGGVTGPWLQSESRIHL